MATTIEQCRPEEGRPPDATPNVSRKHLNRKSSMTHVSKNNKYDDMIHDGEQFDNNNRAEDNVKLVQDINRNLPDPSTTKVPGCRMEKTSLKHSLPKLLCLKKTLISSDDRIERECLKTLNVNSLETLNPACISTKFCKNTKSAFANNVNNSSSCDKAAATSELTGKTTEKSIDYGNYYAEKPRNRNSFHQNVEEALNSLLWQPYEYQNNNGLCNSVSTGSSTPCSSYSYDLDESPDNTTKTATPSSSLLRCNSYNTPSAPQDLHSNVINLTKEVPRSQSDCFVYPRDPRSERSAGATSTGLPVASLSSNSVPRAPVLPATSGDCACDVNNRICGDIMQSVNVNTQPSASNTVLNINASENGLNSFPNTFDSSLNSANIVGLPSNHTRFASVPSGTFQNATTRSNGVFPQHVRNISEPSNQFMKYPNNGSFAAQGSAVVPTHHRHSSQAEQHNTNLQLINHFRSSSVPKSMSIAPKQDGAMVPAGSTINNAVQANNAQRVQQKLLPTSNAIQTSMKPPKAFPAAVPQQQQSNISNVNVNFYRAVPVNVVSSVPTIHCLNTLSNDQGNSVSNVQVLPLESNYQMYQSNTNPTFSNNVTAQVTVHNTNNAIQIPTNTPQISRPLVFTPQVTVPTQNRISNNVVNASTITNFLPPPPPQCCSTINNGVVNIQSNKNVGTSTIGTPITPTNSKVVANNVQANRVTVPPANNAQPNLQENNHVPVTRTRTFTSTEAQTDDIAPVSVSQSTTDQSVSMREQRRRERRERRQNRRISTINHRHTNDTGTQAGASIQNSNDRLPDILNSHLPPPYSTLPGSLPTQNVMSSLVPPPQIMPAAIVPPPHGAMLQTVIPNALPGSAFVFPPPPPQQVVPGQVPLMQAAQPVPVAVSASPTGFRFPFPANGFRRTRFSDDAPKGCCGLLAWKPGSLRWFIALIALVAVCCVLVGTVLGAMRPAGRDHLTVSLLMIGVGIVLVTVSGVAWRLTSHDSSTCRSMLGMGSTESVDVCTRRFVPRLPPSYGRPHHPYAAMMYPEFQYRPPPPSYQASMQEYRLRLLLLDRGNTPQIQAGIQNAVSPPPTYRSHAGSLLRAPLSIRRDATQSEYSCPPSYRSQNSTNRQNALHNGSVFHSREQSLSVSDSNPGEVVNVVSILGSAEDDIALDNITLDSLKMEPDTDLNPLKMFMKGSQSDLDGSKDGNLVTIVQTSDQSPVIVTVSGSSQENNNSSSVQITEIPSEMEILAHL